MARHNFGTATLGGYLNDLLQKIQRRDEIQANIAAEMLIEDLRQASALRPPAYKGHAPTYADGASLFAEVNQYIVTARGSIGKGNFEDAERQVRRAREIFEESPRYPKNPPGTDANR